MADILRRRERKYFYAVEDAQDLKHELRNLFVADRYSGENGGYYVNSTYFDTPGFAYFGDKLEGQSRRQKPRLRSYHGAKFGPAIAHFLEFKNRSGDLVWKERLQVGPDIAERMVDQLFAGPFEEDVEGSDLSRFYYAIRRYNLIPAVSVLYRREALVSTLWPGLRMTIDSGLVGALPGSALSAGKWRSVLNPRIAIIEIKYNHGMPTWLSGVLRARKIERVSVSKYARSVSAVMNLAT